MADDLGKYEVSWYGATHIHTPNIDSIGIKGVRFKDAYVTAPICAPSRAAIFIGKYQQRYGFETQPMDFYSYLKLKYFLAQKAEKRLGDWNIAAEPKTRLEGLDLVYGRHKKTPQIGLSGLP